MEKKLVDELKSCETDLEGALGRFVGDENLYEKCLKDFVNDTTMNDLKKAMSIKDWDAAFTAGHALKGISGNMGFVPLYQVTAEFIVKFRSGRTDELQESFDEITSCYDIIIKVIKNNCMSEENE